MKIEVGKFYKTRNGHKIRVYSTDTNGKYAIHGAIQVVINNTFFWQNSSWTISGNTFADVPNHHWDIISEWVDKKPRLLAYVYLAGGAIHFFSENCTPGVDWTRLPHLDAPEAL